MKTKLILLATIFTLSHIFVFGQEVTVKGKIMDYERNITNPGVSIDSDSKKNIALTDENGLFEIKGNIKSLEFRFIGCYPVKIMNIPNDQGSIDFGEIKMLSNYLIVVGASAPPDEKSVKLDKALKESMLKYNLKVLGHTLKPSFDGKFFVYDFQKQAGIKP
jgi:hypothetical protein